ncbi:hypothetical protein H4R34_001265 [Dimargaris verticillata]|uniref:Post-GPI attachment to proteins factor 3 n=1 Tax=Dimargaris verticillata TaxID=2761393 RepID=A0A9W8B6J4_9FUNG|nr:hypothetical protein H4R34_001265 [Dimargaris verticillata]
MRLAWLRGQTTWLVGAVVCIIVSLAVVEVGGSSGDRLPAFRTCCQTCETDVCQSGDPAQATLPMSLRLFFWTCPQNCQYECMQRITDLARKAAEDGKPHVIHQYFGKWPFSRFLGIQEPASVVFSVLNGYAHWSHWQAIQDKVPPAYFMKPWYLAYVVISVNTWVWSTVFHIRDFGWTEKMDYFSAGFSVLFMLLMALVRIFRLQPGSSSSSGIGDGKNTVVAGRPSPVLKPLIALHLVAFIAHITYLSLWRFDYAYNMMANVVVGICANIAWTIWSYCNRRTHPLAWRPTICVMLISAAMSLELFDFPPWAGILDAHSLWHASTVPIIYLFYNFLIRDAQWDYKMTRLKL